MTLFKQIALILSLFLISILTTVLILNFNSANESVQKRLYEDAKNTASSLSLSLGSANGDITMMSTMINANFDSGNYQFISLVDVNSQILFKRESEQMKIEVPSWFINFLNLKAPVASANVSAGWSPVGLLNVQSDVSFANIQLYTILKNLLISFSLLAFMGLVVLNLLLHAILKPLKNVQFQAEAITRNEFIIQEELPYTKEFKDVVLGMNTMVRKVKAMFDKGNEELRRQKEMEYVDPATKLRNRKYLIDKLPEYLKMDAQSKGGIHMMIGFSGVIEANEKIGHKEVDALFNSMAKVFSAHATNYKNSIVSRINGTEFSILLPDCTPNDGLELAKGIHNSVMSDIKNSQLDINTTFISIGLYVYNYTQTIAQLLSLSDNALASAKFNDLHIHLDKSQDAVEVMGKEAWRGLIKKAISNDGFKFISYKVVDSKNKKDSHNALSLSMVANGTTYYFGQFMASANQAGVSGDIYKKVLDLLILKHDMKLQKSTCSLRLPFNFLDNVDSFDHISKLFNKNTKELPYKLIIEMPDKFISQNSQTVKQYKKLFEENGVDIALFEFIGESQNFEYLKELRPVYIKSEASYLLNQSEQSLAALRLITESIGISIIATGVMDMETLKKLNTKDIYIIQGKATEMLER